MVDAILDGALRAFGAKAGHAYGPLDEAETPSINRIAEVAGVSIGSLYQYFPGKRAIVAALVRRRTHEIHEKLLEVIAASSDLSLDEGAARLVDCMFDMKRSHSRLDDIILREALRHALTAEAFARDADLVERFGQALDTWKPKVRADLPSDVAAHVLFHGLRAVMVVGAIARPDLTVDERTRVEVRRLLVSYLRPV